MKKSLMLISVALFASPACKTQEDKPPRKDPMTSPAEAKPAEPKPAEPKPAEGSGSEEKLPTSPDTPTVPVPALPAITKWEIDPENSSVTFVCKHAMHTKVRGMFQRPSGTILLDEATPANSKIDATIDVKLLTTGVEERDTHLKGPDFFNSVTFPVATFTSTQVAKLSDNTYSVTGNLTMRGVTKPVTLAVTASPPFQHYGSIRRGIEATTSVNRIDFGVGVAAWNVAAESGGLLVGDNVAITIDTELVLKGEEKKAGSGH